jgi:hypothetical protein
MYVKQTHRERNWFDMSRRKKNINNSHPTHTFKSTNCQVTTNNKVSRDMAVHSSNKKIIFLLVFIFYQSEKWLHAMRNI